jgi:hypothetical protein
MSTAEIKGIMEGYISAICPDVKFKDCIKFNVYDYKMAKNKLLLSETYSLKQFRSTLLFTNTGMLFKFDFDFSK